MFSVSVNELILVVAIGLIWSISYVRQRPAARWWWAALLACVVSSIISPADPASTVILTVLLVGFYFLGTRQRGTTPKVAA